MKWLLTLMLISANAHAWQIVNDGVMGGRSQSSLIGFDEYLRFSGNLSLANNGGFASVRRPINISSPEPLAGLALTVRGDGRQYQLRIRTTQDIGRASYAADFPTSAGEWTTITLRPEDFYLTFRGFRFTDFPTIDLNQASALSLYIIDKQEGPFTIDVKSISGFN